MNPLALAIIAVSSWLAAARSKKKIEESDGWDEEIEEEPVATKHTDLDPCYLPFVRKQAKWWTDEGVDLGGEFCPIPAEVEPRESGFPFAVGRPQHWPVRPRRGKQQLKISYWDVTDTIHGKWGREFLSERTNRKTGKKRYHVGVDLPGTRMDKVVAMEAGTVVAVIPNFLPPTWAILVEHADAVVNYGEIEPRSHMSLRPGDRVEAGQILGKIGAHEMLHIETYTKGTTDNAHWHPGEPKPANLLDPSRYLIFASIAEKSKVA